MNSRTKSILFALSAVFFWSTAASAFKIALKYVTPVELLLYSSFVSLAVMTFMVLLSKEKTELKNYSPRDYLKSFLLGLLNPFLYYLILFKAYGLLPAQEALTLNYTWAIMATLFAIPILKQRITIINIIALLISFSGIIVITTRGNLLNFELSNGYGIFLALSSSIVWALFWVLNAKDKKSPVNKLFLNFLSGTLFIILYFILFYKFRPLSFTAIASLIYIGLFEMGITFYLWLNAMKYSRNTAEISNLVYLSPFISLLLIALIIGERILLTTIVGLLLIIIGILLQEIKNKFINKGIFRKFRH